MVIHPAEDGGSLAEVPALDGCFVQVDLQRIGLWVVAQLHLVTLRTGSRCTRKGCGLSTIVPYRHAQCLVPKLRVR